MAWNRYKARAIWQKRRERAAKGGKYMQARRPDICETCRGKIDAGNTIFWQPSPTGRGHVYCEPCARAAGMTTGGAPANDQSAGATSHQAPATATSTDTAATTGNTAEHQTAPTFNTPDTLPTFTKEELIEKIQNGELPPAPGTYRLVTEELRAAERAAAAELAAQQEEIRRAAEARRRQEEEARRRQEEEARRIQEEKERQEREEEEKEERAAAAFAELYQNDDATETPRVIVTDALSRPRYCAHLLAYATDATGTVIYLEAEAADTVLKGLFSVLAMGKKGERGRATTLAAVKEPGERPRPIMVNRDEKYLTTYHETTDGRRRIVVINERVDMFRRQYIFGGTEETPAPHWADMLARHIEIPYKDDWAPALWKKGIEEGTIEKADSIGVNAWHVSRSVTKWERVLIEHLNADNLNKTK